MASSSGHSAPLEGSTCMCCWDDLEIANYVEYQSSADSSWYPSGYCVNCIEQLLATQWESYKQSLAKTTCKAEQRRLLTRGPPINISDAKALPCSEEGAEVHSLWYMNDNQVHSAKLTGSLTGEVLYKIRSGIITAVQFTSIILIFIFLFSRTILHNKLV